MIDLQIPIAVPLVTLLLLVSVRAEPAETDPREEPPAHLTAGKNDTYSSAYYLMSWVWWAQGSSFSLWPSVKGFVFSKVCRQTVRQFTTGYWQKILLFHLHVRCEYDSLRFFSDWTRPALMQFTTFTMASIHCWYEHNHPLTVSQNSDWDHPLTANQVSLRAVLSIPLRLQTLHTARTAFFDPFQLYPVHYSRKQAIK